MRTLRDEAYNREIKVVGFARRWSSCWMPGPGRGGVLFNLETEEYLIARAKPLSLPPGVRGAFIFRISHQQPLWGHRRWADPGLPGRSGKITPTRSSITPPEGLSAQLLGLLVTEKTGAWGYPLNVKGEQFVFHLEPGCGVVGYYPGMPGKKIRRSPHRSGGLA